MCIVHSTLRDTKTPYTERCSTFEKNPEYENIHFKNFEFMNHLFEVSKQLELKVKEIK